jgi:hypothetical protein
VQRRKALDGQALVARHAAFRRRMCIVGMQLWTDATAIRLASRTAGGAMPTAPSTLATSRVLGRLVTLLPAFFAAAFSHAPLLARQTTGALSGTITTLEGAALGGAAILLPGAPVSVLSAADGRYLLSGVEPGARRVEVRLIGYRTAAATLSFEAGVATQWNVVLEVDPIPIAPLEVTGSRAATPQLQGFMARRERGLGHFFTRGEIEGMNARDLTDVLRRVPGARVVPVPGPFGTTNVLQLSRSLGASSGRTCPILYYVNGVPFPVRADIGIDAYVRAQDVEAVEVYSGTSRIPPEFTSTGQTSRCGVVGVWTRIGNGRGGEGPAAGA